MSSMDQLRAVQANPSGSYIFYGPAGTGKAAAVRNLMQRLNCAVRPGDRCASCLLLEAGNHPDFIQVAPAGRSSIGIEQVQDLQCTLKLSRFQAHGIRVVYVSPAEALTPEAQNALLKTLEEPPVGTVLVLATQHPGALLATVRSRCQEVIFSSPFQDTQPETHEAAQKLMGCTLFERLVKVGEVDGEAAAGILTSIAAHTRARLRDQAAAGEASSVRKLASLLGSLEKSRRQLASNVSPRLVMEGLMLEL